MDDFVLQDGAIMVKMLRGKLYKLTVPDYECFATTEAEMMVLAIREGLEDELVCWLNERESAKQFLTEDN